MTRHALLLAALLATALAGCTGTEAAATRIAIDFPDPREDVEATVTLDAIAGHAQDGVPSAYAQLLAWRDASGTSVDIQEFSFGHCVDAIDGVPETPGCSPGAPGYWALSVNGEVAASGMDEIVLAQGDTVTWTYTPLEGSSSSASGGPALTVDPPAPTQGDMAMLTGTLDRAARLSVTGAAPLDAKAGPWMVHVPLEFGQTPVRVVADDGLATAAQDVVLVRLAPATVRAEFRSAVPPRDPIDVALWVDVDGHLSAPQYEGKGIPHPPHANVHDVMAALAAAGHPVEFSYHESFAFGVESIDGHGALSDWCYTVNGESASLGITGQEFRPGDVIEWSGCVVA